MTSVQTKTMTKQQTLQAARNIITGKRASSLADVTRNDLKAGARAMGRSAEAVSKASTLRLAFWASVGKSAIWGQSGECPSPLAADPPCL